MNTPNSNVARIVKTLLTHQGKSRSELAQALHVHVSAVNKAISGQRSWDVNDITRMADFFEVSPALFFEDAETLIRTDGSDISKGLTSREWSSNSLDDTLYQVAA